MIISLQSFQYKTMGIPLQSITQKHGHKISGFGFKW